MMQMKEKKIISVRLPIDLYAMIKAQAEQTNRTVPGYIRYALRKHFEMICTDNK